MKYLKDNLYVSNYNFNTLQSSVRKLNCVEICRLVTSVASWYSSRSRIFMSENISSYYDFHNEI